MPGHGHPILSVALTFNENYIVSVSEDKTIRVWSLQNYTQEEILNGHLGPVATLLTTKSDMIVSGSYDKTITLWNLSGKKSVFIYKAIQRK